MRKNKLCDIIDMLEQGLLEDNKLRTGFIQLDNSIHLNRKTGTSLMISSDPYYHAISLLIPLLLSLAKDGKSVMLFLAKTSITEIIGKILGVPAAFIYNNSINNGTIKKSGNRHLPIYIYDSISCEAEILDEIEGNFSNVVIIEGVDSFDEEDLGSRFFIKTARELVKGFSTLLILTSSNVEESWLPYIDYTLCPSITDRSDTGSLFIEGSIKFQSPFLDTTYPAYYDIFNGTYISPETFNERRTASQDNIDNENE